MYVKILISQCAELREYVYVFDDIDEGSPFEVAEDTEVANAAIQLFECRGGVCFNHGKAHTMRDRVSARLERGVSKHVLRVVYGRILDTC